MIEELVDPLQPLFKDPILMKVPLDPGYEDHASDVWLVTTTSEQVVVRSSRIPGTDEALNDFWWGCNFLFGIEPHRAFEIEVVNAKLREAGGLTVPQALRKGMISGREHIVLERMEGTPLRSFSDLSEDGLRSFGEGLARIHNLRHDHCGHLSGRFTYPLGSFHWRLVETLREGVRRFYGHDQSIQKALESVCEAASSLPPPEYASPILVDMDPTQFLTDGERVQALVDTEACGLGPRELDFIALEYLMDERSAHCFAEGYSTVLPLPELERVRGPYRFLYLLLAVQGHVALEEWMARPAVF